MTTAYVRERYTRRMVPANYDQGWLAQELQAVQRGIPFPTFVDLRDFGVPDHDKGQNSSSSALTQAATQATAVGDGAIVWSPGGIHVVDSRIGVAGLSNVVFSGPGKGATTLQAAGSRTSIISSFPEPDTLPLPGGWQAANITIRGMTLDMNYNVNPDGGATSPTYGTSVVYAADNYQYPIYMYRVNGVTIEDVWFKNSWYNGFEIFACKNVHIFNFWCDHCGDKANFLGYYSGGEVDAASQHVRCSKGWITNGGQGILVNAANGGANDDGVLGAYDLSFDDINIDTMVGTPFTANNRIDLLHANNFRIKNCGKSAMVVGFPEAGTNNFYGPHRVTISNPIIEDYNTSATSGAGAIDVLAADFKILNATITNSLPASASTFHGIITRQLTEKIGGVSTDTDGGQVLGTIARGSFAHGYAVYAIGKGVKVSTTATHDTSGTMVARVSAAGVNSTNVDDTAF